MIRTGVTSVDLSRRCTSRERIGAMQAYAKWIIGQDLWDDDHNRTATVIGAAHVGDRLYVVLEMEGDGSSGHERMEPGSWLMQLIGFLTRRPISALGSVRGLVWRGHG